MKNIDKHNKLTEPDVRDFLAKEASNFGYVGEVEHIRNQILLLEEKLKEAENFEAINKIVESKGWLFFDVSDDIEDYNKDDYFNFIGSLKELRDAGFPKL